MEQRLSLTEAVPGGHNCISTLLESYGHGKTHFPVPGDHILVVITLSVLLNLFHV